jgi:hypothetical protein
MPIELLVPIGIFVLGMVVATVLTTSSIKLVVENEKKSK